MVKIANSGPLLALAALSLAFVLVPADAFANSLGYQILFLTMPKLVWGIVSGTFAIVGYYALYRRQHRAWRISHGFAVVLFLALSITFARGGAWTGFATYLALSANSWLRMRGTYKTIRWTT